jgi:hypothetical protein
MTNFIGTHKTRCMICGGKDDFAVRCRDKLMIDLCYSCASIGVDIADKNTLLFMLNYARAAKKLDPTCHDGSTFTINCLGKFEDIVWQGFLRDWIKKNKKVN